MTLIPLCEAIQYIVCSSFLASILFTYHLIQTQSLTRCQIKSLIHFMNQTYIVGMRGFEPPIPRPPGECFNRTKLHPEMLQNKNSFYHCQRKSMPQKIPAACATGIFIFSLIYFLIKIIVENFSLFEIFK